MGCYAGRMAKADEHRPGDPAPETGHYEELNVFGSPTGRVHHATDGESLPPSPRGFTWRLVRPDGMAGTRKRRGGEAYAPKLPDEIDEGI
jgi:hypothetical protein